MSMVYHIALVGAARPNFMKLAPILRELESYQHIRTTLIHTGQHYDHNMSDIHFQELGIRTPDFNLGIQGKSSAFQVGQVTAAMDEFFANHKTDLVIVVGDVNATASTAMAAAHRHVPVAHVEAGLRSFNWSMPEEINRIVTDRLSHLLFVTEQSGLDNLRQEGINEERVHHVGNVMIDTLLHSANNLSDGLRTQFNLPIKKYGVVTIHRPANVDTKDALLLMIDTLSQAAKNVPLVYPVHARTQKNLREYGLWSKLAEIENLHLTEPAGYFDFMGLLKDARVVLTDSGGIQEETTFLRIPCITLRSSTERPSTIQHGKNRLVPDMQDVIAHLEEVLAADHDGTVPPLWDGKTAKRICEICDQFLRKHKMEIRA